MFSCNFCCITVVLLLLLPDQDRLRVSCNKTDNVWVEAGQMTGLLLHNCLRFSTATSSGHFLYLLQDCLKRRSLLAFDRMLGRDVIDLADGVSLVRYQKTNATGDGRTILSKDASKFDETEEDWKSQVVERLTQVLSTHALKIRLKKFDGLQFEGRRRHKHNNMMSQLLMFALLAAGVIVIPMGFQFLAILGGKALLLAKMALLLTSIQGLKKIATSNLNYGLYSTYGHGGVGGAGGGGPCKGGSLSYGCDPSTYEDNVLVAVDFEDLSHRHYDRQWPYEVEGHVDTFTTNHDNNNHYDILHPRQDVI